MTVDYVLAYEIHDTTGPVDPKSKKVAHSVEDAALFARVREIFVERLALEGFFVRTRQSKHEHGTLFFLLITAPFSLLAREAERVKLNMPLKGLMEVDDKENDTGYVDDELMPD